MLAPLLALFPVTAFQQEGIPGRDVLPLTLDDALSKVYVQAGRIVPVGDLDGDEAPEFAMASVDGNDLVIQAWSARDGRLVRTLWRGWMAGVSSSDLVWDAGGDVDGDGVPDVVVGSPRDESEQGGSGAVVVASEASGAILHRLIAPRDDHSFGSAVAFAGDLDGDGAADIVVGSRNIEHGVDLEYEELHGERVMLPDPNEVQSRLSCGKVTAFSGRSGDELWSVERGLPGEGFGTSLQALGDLDVDGIRDWVVESDPHRSQFFVSLMSGATGAELASISGRGRARPAGDFDGDGVPDICFGSKDVLMRGTHVVSGATLEPLFILSPLDPLGGDADLAQSVGELDGDGFDDLALGAPSYRFAARQANQPRSAVVASTVAETLRLSATLGATTGVSSGCVVVYSGRTRVPIWGVFGRPDQHDLLGFAAAAIPDVSGDGSPDLVVSGTGKTYVFPGPGKSER